MYFFPGTFKNKLILICASFIANYASAACVTTGSNQPIIDPNFQPLSLTFRIHTTSKWDSANNSSTIDQTFLQDILISGSYQQTFDICSKAMSIIGKVESNTTSNTNEVSNHFGKDFSIYPTRATLKSSDSGYAVNGNMMTPQHSNEFSISANAYSSIWDSELSTYTYANYARTISLSELEIGFYSHPLDFAVYLQTKIGSDDFHYSDLANLTNSSYQIIDQYGYTGTATLLSVNTVPVPETIWLFGSGLVGLVATARKRRLNL